MAITALTSLGYRFLNERSGHLDQETRTKLWQRQRVDGSTSIAPPPLPQPNLKLLLLLVSVSSHNTAWEWVLALMLRRHGFESPLLPCFPQLENGDDSANNIDALG